MQGLSRRRKPRVKARRAGRGTGAASPAAGALAQLPEPEGGKEGRREEAGEPAHAQPSGASRLLCLLGNRLQAGRRRRRTRTNRPVLSQLPLGKNGNPPEPLPSLEGGLGGGELHQLPARDPQQGVPGADSQTGQHGGYSRKRT